MCRAALVVTALLALWPQAATAEARSWLLSREPGGHGDSATMAVAGPADRKLVVWAEYRQRSADAVVYSRRVRRNGRPAGPIRRVVEIRGSGGHRLAYNPRRREYLLVWAGTWDGAAREPCAASPNYTPPPGCTRVDVEVHAQRLDAAGRRLGAVRRITATGDPADADATSGGPSLAVDSRNGRFLLAYTATTGEGDVRVRVQALDGRGRNAGLATTVPTPPAVAVSPALAWQPRSGGFLLTYALHEQIREGDLYARPLDAAGIPSGDPVAIAAGPDGRRDGNAVVASPAGDGYLAIWSEGSGNYPGGIFTARPLDAAGRPTAPAAPLTPWTIGAGTVAPISRSRLWIAWEQTMPSDREIFLRPFGVDGKPLGPERRVTRTGPDHDRDAINPKAHHAEFPALSPTGGGRALLAWSARGPRDARADAYARSLGK